MTTNDCIMPVGSCSEVNQTQHNTTMWLTQIVLMATTMRFHNGNWPLYAISSSSDTSLRTSPSRDSSHIRLSPMAEFISHWPDIYCHTKQQYNAEFNNTKAYTYSMERYSIFNGNAQKGWQFIKLQQYNTVVCTLYFVVRVNVCYGCPMQLMHSPCPVVCPLWPTYVIGQDIIFSPCGFFFLSFIFSFTRLISAVGNWMSTIIPYIVWR